MAIVEREMRKFFRSPALMLASMIFPLVQLVILGNAFGGKIRDARLAVVDEDGGPQALRIHEAFDSVRANIRTFESGGQDMRARIEVALDVNDRKQLERILSGVKRIPGVFDIERVYNV